MDWSDKSVLVTGAGGFIGSHLVERLATLGSATRAMVRYNSTSSWGWLDKSSAKDSIQVISGDIRDVESLKRALKGVDIVFHLAALISIPYSYENPRAYVRTNVEGTLNVLQTALESGVQKVVHTSTSEVYGTARYVPIDEEHVLQAQSPYAASKIGADKLAESYHRSFDLQVAIVRPFNTYGPRQSARAVIPAIITQALTQPEVRLGSLEPTRDFNYVADTVEGYIKIAECPEAVGQVINVGSGREISIGDLASTILGLVGKEVPVVCENQRVRPEGSEVDRLLADNGKAKQLTGWQPQYTLEQGLTQVIDWINSNLDRFKGDVYVT